MEKLAYLLGVRCALEKLGGRYRQLHRAWRKLGPLEEAGIPLREGSKLERLQQHLDANMAKIRYRQQRHARRAQIRIDEERGIRRSRWADEKGQATWSPSPITPGKFRQY